MKYIGLGYKFCVAGFYRMLCILTILFFANIATFCKSNVENGLSEAKEEKTFAPQIYDVEVMELEQSSFKKQLISNGKLVAKQRSQLSFATSGIISSIMAENGSYVAKGTVIAELDASDVRESLRSALINLQKTEIEMYDYLVGLGYKARDTLSVAKDLLESVKLQSGYSYAKSEYSRVKNEASKRLLIAPFSGKIADISKTVHEQASGVFCTLINDKEFNVDFPIMSSELHFCKKGMSVKVLPFGMEGEYFYGKIININPTVNSNGQIIITASVLNNNTLIDGIDVKVIVEKDIENQMVVPKSAVVIRDGLDVLFTYTPDSLAHWKYVNIIASNEDSYAIEPNKERASDLSIGDKIIISGNLNLADKSKVNLKK